MVRPLAGEGPRGRAPDLRFHATFVFFSESNLFISIQTLIKN